MKPGSIQYEAMVFDMDGVIFDSERAVIGCWIELAEKYGFQEIESMPCLYGNNDGKNKGNHAGNLWTGFSI